jgi:hypothetical protein
MQFRDGAWRKPSRAGVDRSTRVWIVRRPPARSEFPQNRPAAHVCDVGARCASLLDMNRLLFGLAPLALVASLALGCASNLAEDSDTTSAASTLSGSYVAIFTATSIIDGKPPQYVNVAATAQLAASKIGRSLRITPCGALLPAFATVDPDAIQAHSKAVEVEIAVSHAEIAWQGVADVALGGPSEADQVNIKVSRPLEVGVRGYLKLTVEIAGTPSNAAGRPPADGEEFFLNDGVFASTLKPFGKWGQGAVALAGIGELQGNLSISFKPAKSATCKESLLYLQQRQDQAKSSRAGN